MDCMDLFKKAAAAMQTDSRYLELDAARRANDADQELRDGNCCPDPVDSDQGGKDQDGGQENDIPP